MKIINEHEYAWQLENGLWYPKRRMQCPVCPKCGSRPQIRHTWSMDYIICQGCMVHWKIGPYMIYDHRREMYSEKEIIDTLELLSETEEVSHIFKANPLPNDVEIMLMELREKIPPKTVEDDYMSTYDFKSYMW